MFAIFVPNALTHRAINVTRSIMFSNYYHNITCVGENVWYFKSTTAPVVHATAPNQGTILAAFDKLKRKLSPEKEADTLHDNHKVSRGEQTTT